MRTPSIVQKGWFIPAVFFAIAIPLALALMGLNRPYDAIPDQDLLWASEALRLHSGRGPSYADHPGIYWTLSFLLKLKYLPTIGIDFLTKDGFLSPDGAKNLIQISRLENGLLCGLCSISFIPIMRCLGISRILTIAGMATITCSTGLLTAVSEIRNEITSVIFMSSYINLNLLASNIKNNSNAYIPNRTSIALALVAIPCFFAAAFCKQQVLLASPLIFVAALASNKGSLKTATTSLRKKPHLAWLAVLLIGLLPWIFAASPDIDLINAPFWIAINLGLWITLSATSSLPQTAKNHWQLGLFIGITEIATTKVLAFNWWRQAVTGFPSWMFYNANHKDQVQQGVAALIHYAQDSSVLIALCGVSLFVVIVQLIYQVTTSDPSRQAQLQLFSIGFSLILLIANTARFAVRYEIYFFPAIFISLLWITSTSFQRQNQNIALKFSSLTLISLIAIRSILNLTALPTLINEAQPRSFLCFGQHMDRLMELTCAGSCKNFEEAAIGKNQYDSKSGP